MKPLICFITHFIISNVLYAQNTVGVRDDLKGIVLHNANVNTTTITTFNNSEVRGTRYLYSDWIAGSVTNENNETYSENYTFNFDKINHDLYAKNNNISVVIDKSKIKYFTIGYQKFINSSLIDAKVKGLFYEVLVNDTSKISLYKLTITKFVKADPTNMMNVKTGNFSSEYVDEAKYFVSNINGQLNKINLTENNIKKVLKFNGERLNTYFALHSTEDVDENFLIRLIKFLN